MAEDKTKVNVKEDGTPIKPGEDGYLIAGKYKTIEDAEQGIKEGEQKITALGQGKSASDKALLDYQKSITAKEKEAEKGKLKTADEARLERIKNFKKVFEDPEGGGPAAAYAFVESMIADSHKTRDTKAGDLEKQRKAYNTRAAAEYNRVRGTGNKEQGLEGNKERQKEFDLLKPVMDKLWEKLPPTSRVPEMMETIFLAARAKASPELREQIVQEIKAGMGTTGPGVKPGEEVKTEDDKTLDAIAEQAEKDKGGL